MLPLAALAGDALRKLDLLSFVNLLAIPAWIIVTLAVFTGNKNTKQSTTVSDNI